jgi:hypothetical protein
MQQCANPNCAIPLRLLREGRLFQFEIRSQTANSSRPKLGRSRATSVFWLCGQCSSKLTLVFDRLKGVITQPLPTI